MTRTVAPRKILTEMRCKTVGKPTARAETVLVRRQVKITSESDTIERRDDGPVTRVVPRFIIVPNFLSGAFLFEKATGADRQQQGIGRTSTKRGR